MAMQAYMATQGTKSGKPSGVQVRGSGAGYCFIESKLNGNVIDFQGATTQAGALLDAYPQKASGSDNQLWEFLPDPAGSGFYFIKSKLSGNVIDIQGVSTKAGAHLDAFPQKAGGNNNQLWAAVGGTFPSAQAPIVARKTGAG